MKSILLLLLLVACIAASAQTAVTTSIRNADDTTNAAPPVEMPLIAVGPGYIVNDVGAIGTGWIVNTPHGGNAGGSSPASTPSGGIGSVEPLRWGMTFGAIANLWISTRAYKSQAQALFVQKSKGCDTCNAMAFDQFIEPVGGATTNQDVEADISQNSSSDLRLHMGGFQCNQQKGNPAYGHWQIDNQQNKWVTIPLTADCPLPANTYTEVGLMISWDDSDLSCGSYGCTTFQYAWFNGIRYPINVKLQSYTEKHWASYAGIQHQLYASGSDSAGDAVTTTNRLIKNATYIIGSYEPSSTSTLNPALQ